MRASLVTSIGVACTAALVLPLSSSGAIAAPQVPQATQNTGSAAVPGSTQSLPLGAAGSDRSLGGAAEQGVTRRDVSPFSLLGVVWDDADAELHGTVQVRTRAAGSHLWSDWQDLETHNQEHGADPGTTERDSGHTRGSTAPLWVGGSDGVELRVRAAEENENGPARAPLPQGLRLELIDPGEDPQETPDNPDNSAGPRDDSEPEPDTAISPEHSGDWTRPEDAPPTSPRAGRAVLPDFARSYAAPRPRIITRPGWGADERLRERRLGYSRNVKAAFVHHSATGNNYSCKQAPSVLRSIYRYHVKSSGWRDIGYNFAIDKCGNIYEGRAGGVTRPVRGAHTLGFNTNSVGIAVLGTYGGTNPRAAATTAVARLTAWKLGLHGVDARGKVTLTSAGNGKYGKGRKVRLNAISGHRDGFFTDCPGSRLYGKLSAVRKSAGGYQRR
ncbi:N-acetylmuramoyl-L-alanine amidase [Streptomyces scopuliridis]|uniref:N-acetylmuramoyl-L-alanine amidase n=1 Tax=Streptomyces scopuliridis TaxID=452529 RepID=A0ACD4ZP54_9ACTN|nr:N-acetylmuramoyl-L-alanine amidase [Streptomyces scopuliridis]WSB99768.1 N-acetylmuramoyl-L-alanine amidase [Streptomyces scopuliridis]WSC06533.1 N-acetylmuramoyl-L-alanine amidase [Streptomyces scopuliridis]